MILILCHFSTIPKYTEKECERKERNWRELEVRKELEKERENSMGRKNTAVPD